MDRQVLRAADWDGRGDISALLDFLRREDALLDHASAMVPKGTTGEPHLVHRVGFDAHKVRNTHVHGVGFRCGFLVSIEFE